MLFPWNDRNVTELFIMANCFKNLPLIPWNSFVWTKKQQKKIALQNANIFLALKPDRETNKNSAVSKLNQNNAGIGKWKCSETDHSDGCTIM